MINIPLLKRLLLPSFSSAGRSSSSDASCSRRSQTKSSGAFTPWTSHVKTPQKKLDMLTYILFSCTKIFGSRKTKQSETEDFVTRQQNPWDLATRHNPLPHVLHGRNEVFSKSHFYQHKKTSVWSQMSPFCLWIQQETCQHLPKDWFWEASKISKKQHIAKPSKSTDMVTMVLVLVVFDVYHQAGRWLCRFTQPVQPGGERHGVDPVREGEPPRIERSM